ncbi:hypothetical protein DFS34DRAFT_74339 [Phlyctochytrium arcticum]|nr:hypothetical protein DFS34DRAFT_74339 [Phlyctochytrium arcticum]
MFWFQRLRKANAERYTLEHRNQQLRRDAFEDPEFEEFEDEELAELAWLTRASNEQQLPDATRDDEDFDENLENETPSGSPIPEYHSVYQNNRSLRQSRSTPNISSETLSVSSTDNRVTSPSTHLQPAIKKLTLRPPSPATRRNWGHAQPEVDFDGEVRVWEKTNRIVRKMKTMADQQAPSDYRTPLQPINKIDGHSETKNTHAADPIKRSSSGIVKKKNASPPQAPPPMLDIQSEDLVRVAEGLLHLTNAITAQLDETVAPVSPLVLDELIDEDTASESGKMFVNLFQGLTSRSTQLMAKIAEERKVQQKINEQLKHRVEEVEGWLVSLQAESIQNKAYLDSVQEKLEVSTKAHSQVMSSLSDKLKMLLLWEEAEQKINDEVKHSAHDVSDASIEEVATAPAALNTTDKRDKVIEKKAVKWLGLKEEDISHATDGDRDPSDKSQMTSDAHITALS